MQHDEAKRIAEEKIAAAIAEYEERAAIAVAGIELRVGTFSATNIDDPHTPADDCSRASSTSREAVSRFTTHNEFGTGPKLTRACIAASP